MSFNWPLARRVMQEIHEHPEQHNQEYWHTQTSCGTTMCFAGWVAHLTGWEPNLIEDDYEDGRLVAPHATRGVKLVYFDEIARRELCVERERDTEDFKAYLAVNNIMFESETEQDIARRLNVLARVDTDLQAEAWAENERRSAA